MLDAHKNLFIDLAARVPEIGRIDANHDPKRPQAWSAPLPGSGARR